MQADAKGELSSDAVPRTHIDPFEVVRLRDEIALLKFLETVRAHLRNARDAESAMRFIVRACRDHFDATAGCLAIIPAPNMPVQLLFAVPQEQVWHMPQFEAVLRGEKPPVQPNFIFARIRRRDRTWGVLALRRAAGEFSRADRQALVRVGVTISELLSEIDAQRIREVRDRIDRKIMSEVRPIDLSYQILDALRSLTGYDHSSAVLMSEANGTSLKVVAEQIAWRKAKSDRIGATLAVSADVVKLLQEGSVFGFTRVDEQWDEWEGRYAGALPTLLDYNRADKEQIVSDLSRETQILCAPIGGRDGLIGVIKVSATHPGTLGPFEGELLSAFLPQVAIAIQNAQRTESLESKMIAAERKHAMADLARGVSHDLNNALGSVLPLVQQMCEEAASGSLDEKTAAEDLKQIERSLHVCRRIFSGMLTFARRAAGASGAVGHGQVQYALDCAMAILEDNLRRRGISVVTELEEPLLPVPGGQSALEQIVLNLLTNARDAMPDGGEIRISAARDASNDSRLRIVVADSGCGIPPENLPFVLEPFFTTKPQGNGLGLSICRSIVWDIGGQILFDSEVGRGTKVTLLLPALVDVA